MPRSDREKLTELLEVFEKLTTSMIRVSDQIEKIYAALFAAHLKRDGQ